jgi:hypothetical protein
MACNDVAWDGGDAAVAPNQGLGACFPPGCQVPGPAHHTSRMLLALLTTNREPQAPVCGCAWGYNEAGGISWCWAVRPAHTSTRAGVTFNGSDGLRLRIEDFLKDARAVFLNCALTSFPVRYTGRRFLFDSHQAVGMTYCVRLLSPHSHILTVPLCPPASVQLAGGFI